VAPGEESRHSPETFRLVTGLPNLIIFA